MFGKTVHACVKAPDGMPHYNFMRMSLFEAVIFKGLSCFGQLGLYTFHTVGLSVTSIFVHKTAFHSQHTCPTNPLIKPVCIFIITFMY